MDGTSSPAPGLDSGRPRRRIRLAPPLRLFGVNYDDYCRLRDDERISGLRMTYVDGMLEVMSPEYLHEGGAVHLAILDRIVADVIGIDDTGAGSTTFRKGTAGQPRGRGKAPDRCFYFAREPLIRGKTSLDLEHDPPRICGSSSTTDPVPGAGSPSTPNSACRKSGNIASARTA